MKGFAGVLVSIALLAGCSESDQFAEIGSSEVSNEQFENHLAFKRVPSENAERVEQEKERFIEQYALKQAIIDQELLSMDVVSAEVSEFENQLIINNYLNTYLESVVTDAAVENYYKAHQEDYSAQQAQVAHIVFRTHSAMTEAEKQAAQQSARNMVTKLAKGESFDELAREYSDDRYSGEKGGDLGWLSLNSIDPAMATVINGMEPDQVSDIVKTKYGYHVLKLLSPIKTEVIAFKNVQGDIRYLLRQKAKTEEINRLVNSVNVNVK